ncbi:MAG: hypothetical protein M3Q00_02005 [Pseudomonadota bacterium]|nr:hypothetical protein [Pseudomonadota bacterium]
MLKIVFAMIFAMSLNAVASASELILEHTAIETSLKRDVFNAEGGRYHLVDPTTCAYSYLDLPQVSIAAGRLRIKSHFTSQVASQVGGECVGSSDEFDITVSGRPVYRNDKLVMDDVRLDDATDLVWRPLIEVFIKSAASRVFQINLKEALQRMFKDASTPYEVSIEKIQVTKLLAEDNRIKATFDFVLRAR